MISAVSSYRPALAPRRPAAVAPILRAAADPAPAMGPAPAGPVTTLPDPANPLKEILAAPVNAALVLADLAQAVLHPLRTIKSLWSLFGNVRAFDAMTPLAAQAGPRARDTLHAAVSDLKASGLQHVLGFMARAIDRRAGVAFEQLRPSVESTLGARISHPVVLTWPAAGRNWTALDDTIAIQNVLAVYPDAAVQKAFDGVREVQVVDPSIQGYFEPVRRSGAALVVTRPLGIVPGERRIDEALMAYLNAIGRVTAGV